MSDVQSDFKVTIRANGRTTVTEYKFDQAKGKVVEVLPTVKIGHERLAHNSSGLAGKGFIICKEHATAPRCFVRGSHPVIFHVCCRKCVEKYCKITEAVVRPQFLADGSPILDSDAGNPEGHSF